MATFSYSFPSLQQWRRHSFDVQMGFYLSSRFRAKVWPFFHATAPWVTRNTAQSVLIMCFPMVFLMFIIGRYRSRPRNQILFGLLSLSRLLLASAATHRGNITQWQNKRAANVKSLSNIFRFYYRFAFGAFFQAHKMTTCGNAWCAFSFHFHPFNSHFRYCRILFSRLSGNLAKDQQHQGHEQRANLVSCSPQCDCQCDRLCHSAPCSSNWKRQRLFTPEFLSVIEFRRTFKLLRSIFS